MKTQEKYHLFWGGEFSQWYPSTFEIDGKTYNCAEQWMMEQKALFFGDKKMAKRIMETKQPREQKALGRKVSNFDAEQWMKNSYDIVLKGNIAKFSQNPELLKVLLDTGDIEIVEASPYDKIWGIGLGENDPRAQDKSQWDGMNLLGKVVMDTRNWLKTE
jgi:ribA/ribD-fused uncharacterized protein